MNRSFFTIMALLGLAFFVGCEPDQTNNSLKVTPAQAEFGIEGGSVSVVIETDADSWKVSGISGNWFNLSATKGGSGVSELVLSVGANNSLERTAKVTIGAGNAEPVELSVQQQSAGYRYLMSVDTLSLAYKLVGGTQSIQLSTTAPNWQVSADADWLTFDVAQGNAGNTPIAVTAATNTESVARTATISILADEAPEITIAVSQIASLYPSYNTSPIVADKSGMISSAVELAAKIKLGWNLGNTLEAIGSETAWGSPKVTQEQIDMLKREGFNAVRIPCSWYQYMEDQDAAKIRLSWLNRVKEVVQYCVNNDMYVLLNIHWDGGWLENNCTPEKQVANNAMQKAFWEQIATHLRDFDEHLLFAGANEPNVENSTQMAVLASYYQTFVDAVRATGGRNAHRVLVVQGPSTDIEKTNKLMHSLPTDVVADRMMVEVHFYTPYPFCLMTEDASWGKMFYYWGNGYHSTTLTDRNATWGEEADVDRLFGLMKTQFVDKGIPVVLGEYAASRRMSLTGDDLALHLESRVYYLTYVTQQAKAYGLLPFYWDAGGTGDLSSGLFDRANGTVFDQKAIDGMVAAFNK